MKATLFLALVVLLCSCAGNGVRLTQTRLAETGGTEVPLDTLAAYRKMPGGEKSVKVKGYTRKDGRVVEEHQRTRRRTKTEMPTQ